MYVKREKNLYAIEIKPYLIVSMIVEMMIDENLEITDKDKVILKDKIPSTNYNKKLYEIIKEIKKSEVPLKSILMSICYGLSTKKLRSIVDLLKDNMLKNELITMESKKGLLGNKEVIKIDENKFKNIIQEIKTEFLEKGNLTEDLILLTSLLASTNFIKNIFSKYEKKEINNKLKEIKHSEIAEKVKIAQSTINVMHSIITVMTVNASTPV